MNFRKIKQRNISFSEFQTVIDQVAELSEAGFPFVKGKPTDKPIDIEIYVYQTSANIHIIGRYLLRPKIEHLVLNTTGKDVYEADVASYYRELTKYCDESLNVKDTSICHEITSSPFYYRNTNYEYQDVPNCTCYDVNKSYLNACQFDMPDTSLDLGMGIVEEDQIGFRYTGKQIEHTYYDCTSKLRDVITMSEPGEWADFRFSKTESPLKKWAQFKTDQLNTTKDKSTRSVIKESIVCAIGNLQNHNPFLRAAVVGYATKKIQKLIDKDTIYCNTDCIVSLKPRTDLSISDKVGDFKIEAEGTFKFIGYNYWWSNGKKAERGNHHVDDKDIITFNWESRKLEWLRHN